MVTGYSDKKLYMTDSECRAGGIAYTLEAGCQYRVDPKFEDLDRCTYGLLISYRMSENKGK